MTRAAAEVASECLRRSLVKKRIKHGLEKQRSRPKGGTTKEVKEETWKDEEGEEGKESIK